MPKVVFGNVYVHRDYVHTLSENDRKLMESAKEMTPVGIEWNLVKVAADKKSVTFGWYPGFEDEVYPILVSYVKVDLESKQMKMGKGSVNNPLILHRKETFVDKLHPRYEEFVRQSEADMKAGLYDPKYGSRIGRKNYWDEIRTAPSDPPPNLGGGRRQLELFNSQKRSSLAMAGKTAMHRRGPSVLAQTLGRLNWLQGKIFDWGCGRGQDIDFYRSLGLEADGWDPVYRSGKLPNEKFDWVTCAFVLNVLPTRAERLKVLQEIENLLSNEGRVAVAVRSRQEIERLRKPIWQKYCDGWITTHNTFQKGFKVEELVDLVSKKFGNIKVIGEDPVMVVARK